MNKKLVLVLILCLVGALSIPAASAPVESTIISPSVSAQPLTTSVPDSPGASDEDQGRAASFRAALEANGFIVNSGQMTPVDPIVDLLDSGIGDSANGNNAGQPYKVLMVPISPFGEENPFERGLTIFRLRPDEAVVYLGPTPPQCDYFSFTVYLWVRHKDSLVRKGDWMVAAVNDPLNSALIRTEGNGTPFRNQTIVIFTADRGVYERVAALAQEAGYPESMINPYVIPSGLLNLGVLPETPLADSFTILVRTANFASMAEGIQYLSDDQYARVWRVTPEPAPAPDLYPTPELRVRKWKSETELYPDLNNGLERLKNAILAQTPNVSYESYESVRWFADSREVLEETDPGSPLYHKFVAGEGSDTPYLRTSLSGEAANFTLGNDDMVVVYGVNHAATGLATYSNFGVYGDWVTSSCQDNPLQYVFGCGDRSWNGVVSMTNHAFTGSAEEYIPGDPMAPYLYAVKVLRQPPQDKHDTYFVVVPTATPEHPCASPGYCLGLNDPVIIGYRAYLNPATASGADYDDIIHDRALHLQRKEPIQADFTAEPKTGIPPLSVQFSDLSSGNPTMWMYDFGDGVWSTDPSPNHTYQFPGTYTVNLTVRKFDETTRSFVSNTSSQMNVIRVEGNLPVKIIANSTAIPTYGTAPLTVQFTDHSTGKPTMWMYDFGDGVWSTDPNPNHTYQFPGTYTVNLTVRKFDETTRSFVSDTSSQMNVITVI